MVTIIINISKYAIIVFMALYTMSCFTVYLKTSEETRIKKINHQIIYVFMIHFLSYLTLLLRNPKNMKSIFLFYLIQIFVSLSYMLFYHYIYPYSSRIITNNMSMLLLVGYIMLTRLHFDVAKNQFFIATVSMILVSIIPYIMDHYKGLRKYGLVYGVLGILLLGSVFVIGIEKYGSLNWIQIGGIVLQPSEFVKIIFSFFLASMLGKKRDFKQVVIVTIFATIYIGILVLEIDLGGALIFFVIFIFSVYIGTGKIRYPIIYVLSGVLLLSIAFLLFRDLLFGHVMVRIEVWRNPWLDINVKGYQICQSLFAIGSGGFFGTGLTQGSPYMIPVVESDFIFSAISEELGACFSILLILVCFSCFLEFINIALNVRYYFYKIMAFSLATCYIFQTFLSIGGVIKFIPSTGVTIPFVSYGGSSMLSSMILFSIMQGISTIGNKEAKKVDEERRKIEESKNKEKS